MRKVDILIVGSGVGGLGAASWAKARKKSFLVVDGIKELPVNLHNGVHYLHSVPELPFDAKLKEVTLTDGILSDGEIVHTPNLVHSLKYSEKVREVQHPSSIMDIGKHKSVYMPATNSLNELVVNMYEYSGKENYLWNFWLDEIDVENHIGRFKQSDSGEFEEIGYGSLVCTAPLDKMMVHFPFLEMNDLKMESNPVYISNFIVNNIVPNWLINLYIPNQYTPIYRASFLNNVCSVESIKLLDDREIHQIPELLNMFHISLDGYQKYTWKTGKVLSISKDDRYKVVSGLLKKDIYQIGRFGLWNRKLLVDSTINQARNVIDYTSKQGFLTAEELIKYLA